MTATIRRLIGAPSPSPLAVAEDRLDGLSSNPNAVWGLWHGRYGWMVGRLDIHDGTKVDEYGPHVCPRSAAYHAEQLEADWSRTGDPVNW